MKDYPYFKAYIAEILMDTMSMNQSQKGDYLDSLIRSWKSMNPSEMPDWMREYADETISKSRKLSANSKIRWSTAMQLHTKCIPIAMQKTYKRGEDRIGEDRIGDSENAFALFWGEYPKKASKPQAKNAFLKAIKKADLGKILESVKSQKDSDNWKKDGGQYIPNPATWLNGERWNDTIEIEKPKTRMEQLKEIDEQVTRNLGTLGYNQAEFPQVLCDPSQIAGFIDFGFGD
jgi:uncharacterized protein YdaU (DUF1376 family)